MKRIDAHQHFWRLAARAGSWPPPALAPIYRDFLPPELAPLLAANGIDATVLVQSLPTRADTDFLLQLARETPFVAGVVGWVDLKAPDAARQIDALAQDPRLKGLRPMLQDIEDETWIDDPVLDPAIDAMVRNRLVFDALVLPQHLPALLAFARRHPALTIVIDHAAKPAIASAAVDDWAAGLAALAALPQVCCKLSGLVTEARPDWCEADLEPYARVVLAAFGPERVIWGSDWPVLNLALDYAGWIDTSAALLDALSPAARDQVLGLNAMRIYRLGGKQ
ncbi:amidohydrolase family protein [Massilia sp. S19_KUP03_FR1]|uniref:amidohydrolase family protein n=1 Tax=Massilia sp. S19_KUP03_FR1 TaxID=3025503 RepID=UPI002FCDA1D2